MSCVRSLVITLQSLHDRSTKSGVYSIYKGMTYKGDRGIYGQDSSWLTPAPPITVPRRDKEEKRKTDREGAAFRKEMRVTF